MRLAAFVVAGCIVAWLAYEFALSDRAADFRRTVELCERIAPGTERRRVRALVSAHQPGNVGTNFAWIGYGSCRCNLSYMADKVASVGRPYCSHKADSAGAKSGSLPEDR